MPAHTRKSTIAEKEAIKLVSAHVPLMDINKQKPMAATAKKPGRKRRKLSVKEMTRSDSPTSTLDSDDVAVGSTKKRKRRAVVGRPSKRGHKSSRSEADPYDLESCTTHESFEIITKLLEQVQDSSDQSQRTMCLKRLDEYYHKQQQSNRTPNREMVSQQHQQTTAASLWVLMFPVLQSEKNAKADILFGFFKMAALRIGFRKSSTRKSSSGLKNISGLPLFRHILHFVLLYHSDQSAHVRFRMINLVKVILEKFHDDENNCLDPVRNQILSKIINHRIRDKVSAIRATALRCFPYFNDQKSTRKLLSFSLNYDPSPEVRRIALVILPHFPTIKSDCYFKGGFDPSETVRAEAFSMMSKLPMSRIGNSAQERQKLIHWGLNQPCDRVRQIVRENMLPEWLRQCNNSLVSLFSELAIDNKLNTGRLIVDAIYPDGSTKEFDDIDWSFLPKDQKIIPIPELTLEKAQVWVLLCRKFRNTPFCAHHLLPETFQFVTYIKDIVQNIRASSQQEDPDEDYPKFITLALMLKLCEILDFEESIRREMIQLLRKILLDPIIQDSVIINPTVDLAVKLIERNELASYADSLMEDIFGWSNSYDGEGETEKQDEEISNIGSKMLDQVPNTESRKEVEVDDEAAIDHEYETRGIEIEVATEDDDDQVDIREATTQKLNAVAMEVELEEAATQKLNAVAMEVEVEEAATQKLNAAATEPEAQPRRVTVAEKLLEIRSAAAETALQRHRLITELEKSSRKSDYLHCHTLQQQIDTCIEKEKELQVQIEDLRLIENQDVYFDEIRHEDILDQSIIRGGDLSFIPPISRMSMSIDEEDEDEYGELNQASMDQGESMIVLGDSILKALTIMLRFLVWTRTITPVVDDICKHNVVECITNQDARVRAYTIRLLSIYGKLDKSTARRSMLVSLQAMRFDDGEAQIAGFETTIDLLIRFPFEFFRPDVLNSGLELPPPFDDPNAKVKDIENAIISLLNNFGQNVPTEREVIARMIGFSRLFLSGRIKNVKLLADYLVQWVNPDLAASPAVSLVGRFIPYYCIIKESNCVLLFEAFVLCVKTVVDCQESNEGGLGKADVLKLAEYLAMNTREEVISRFKDPHLVHEKGFMRMLEEVKENIGQKCSVQFARSLKFFNIATPKARENAERSIYAIIGILSNDKTLIGAVQVKAALKAVLRQFKRRFEVDLCLTTIKEEPEDLGGKEDDRVGGPDEDDIIFFEEDDDKESLSS